jgi:hypothetical protein
MGVASLTNYCSKVSIKNREAGTNALSRLVRLTEIYPRKTCITVIGCIPFAFRLEAISQKPGNSIVFDTPESTPAGYKSLILECCVTSQAVEMCLTHRSSHENKQA